MKNYYYLAGDFQLKSYLMKTKVKFKNRWQPLFLLTILGLSDGWFLAGTFTPTTSSEARNYGKDIEMVIAFPR